MMNDLVEKCHENARNKEFWPENAEKPVNIDFILAKLALVHSEVSETLEALRKQQGSDKVLGEVADILIRVFDLVGGMAEHGWTDSADIESVVLQKMGVNSNRPRLHGNLA